MRVSLGKIGFLGEELQLNYFEIVKKSRWSNAYSQRPYVKKTALTVAPHSSDR